MTEPFDSIRTHLGRAQNYESFTPGAGWHLDPVPELVQALVMLTSVVEELTTNTSSSKGDA